jgi:N-dimethylarginine dimethylaminohydrolase
MPKRYLMCPPTYFDIEYEINAWMNQNDQVDQAKALHQWETIKSIYERLGHTVELIDPVKGLPDMIFTANGGQVIDGKVMVAKFKYAQRQPETAIFKDWFEKNGYKPVVPENDWEGEGDCLPANGLLFAGYGFRSDKAAAAELDHFFKKTVVSLKLIDPRFYHLDTCFCPLDARTIMYFPGAFDEKSLQKIRSSGLMLIEAAEEDADGFGLNAVSDGTNVVLSDHAKGLIGDLRRRGYNPIPVDVSEFKKSGGGVKCVTLELRP